jgi:hypothetical protein
MLTNAALERAGVEAGVSHASLRSRLLSREAAVYTRAEDKAQVEARRAELHRSHHPIEATENGVRWREQKAREGIRDVSREAMIDHVRDKFWLRDTSPAREQERQASVWRTIHREHQRTGRPFQGLGRAPAQPPVPMQQLAQRLRRLQQRLEEPEQVGSALRVRLWEDEERQREQARGIGW